MKVDIAKICRICLAEGARNIFEHTNSGGVSSLENISEKMRYVTMSQIKENDNLPKMICDICIVHLNVSYTFKRLAVDNDVKLRQYLIEKGLGVINDSPPSASYFYSSNIAIVQSNQQQRPPNSLPNVNVNNNRSFNRANNCLLPMPIAIKNEPIEIINDNQSESSVTLINNNNQDVCCSVRNNSDIRDSNLMVIVNDNTLLTQSQPSTSSFSSGATTTQSVHEKTKELIANEIKELLPTNNNHLSNTIIENSKLVIPAIELSDRESRDTEFIQHYVKNNYKKILETHDSTITEKSIKSLDLRKILKDQQENFKSSVKLVEINLKNKDKEAYQLRKKTEKPIKKNKKKISKAKTIIVKTKKMSPKLKESKKKLQLNTISNEKKLNKQLIVKLKTAKEIVKPRKYNKKPITKLTIDSKDSRKIMKKIKDKAKKKDEEKSKKKLGEKLQKA